MKGNFMKSLIVLCIFLISGSTLLAQQSTKEKPDFSAYYYHKKDLFEKLPNDENEIIFLGNSITDGAEWSELFDDLRIKNRGISGDITDGILYRLEEVTESRPAKIFLMIGVNDLARGTSQQQMLLNYEKIIKRIKDESPKTELYIESILPVNNSYTKFKNHVNKNSEIIRVNNDLKALAMTYSATYIDLHSSFKDINGKLDAKYTEDGLHINGAGYLLWKSKIEKYINDK
jgi:lysophospholipase L1-like esterase